MFRIPGKFRTLICSIETTISWSAERFPLGIELETICSGPIDFALSFGALTL